MRFIRKKKKQKLADIEAQLFLDSRTLGRRVPVSFDRGATFVIGHESARQLQDAREQFESEFGPSPWVLHPHARITVRFYRHGEYDL